MHRGLAIETSSRVGSVALVEDGHVVAEDEFPHGLQHAAQLVVRIDQLCKARGWMPADLEELYVSVGPGSFTGLRIGITLAKTLAFATGARIVAVPTVQVLAENAPADAGDLIIVLDAKRDQLFTARFARQNNRWVEREPAHLDDLASMLARAPRPVWLLGEGIPHHRQFIPADDASTFVSDPGFWQPRAVAVATIGMELTKQAAFVDPDRLVPLYIRKPEAQEVWERKQGQPSSVRPILLLFALVAFLGCSTVLADESTTTHPAAVSETVRRHVRELSRQALALIDQRDFVGAERVLRQAIDLAPDNSTCPFNLACVHAAMNRPRDAMDDLERAVDAGFTDFSRLKNEKIFARVRELPRFAELMTRHDEIVHRAAGRIVEELKKTFGDKYHFNVDEHRKLVLAARMEPAELEALAQSLRIQAGSETELIFSHTSDEFIRVVVATPLDFAKLEDRAGVHGRYDDASRTVLVTGTGAELRHEFTHALHAADQHALDQEHPVWLSEGLATLYEYPRSESLDDGQEHRLLPADTWRLSRVQAAAAHQSLIPLSTLLEMKRSAFSARADLAYGEAGSLLMYLYEHHQLADFYHAYTAGYSKDPTGRAALEKTTGMSLVGLQQAWVDWLLPRPVSPRHGDESIR
jgi:tRNA threonylcarbamoyladenosine biosynthesis protein TsaB